MDSSTNRRSIEFDRLQIELFERYRKLYKEEKDISKQNLQKLTY